MSPLTVKKIKALLFFVGLLPLVKLGWLAFHEMLGANPVEFVTRFLGDWTIIGLMLTLSITPLRIITNQVWVIQLRRMVGLYAFFYATLHFLSYAWLDHYWDMTEILHDIAKHRYVIIGFSAWILLIPLAVTSNKAMIKRLKQRWQTLHKLVYVIAIFGVVHYWWLVKKDITEPVVYALILFLLFSIRIFKPWLSKALSRLSATAVKTSAQI